MVYKSIVSSDEKILRMVKNFGHKFVCIDEEGILQWEDEYKLQLRYGQRCLEMLDALILLNQKQFELLEENYNINKIKDKIFISGYPRIQFLGILNKNENQCKINQYIKNKYKRYIFFPTSFPSNHVMGKAGYERSFAEALGSPPKEKQKLFMDKILDLISIMEKNYRDILIRLINDYKDINIVLRPHPTEDLKTYKSFRKFKNLFIDLEYPSFYYLKNSICTIQYGSTISVESYIMNNKTYQLKNFNEELSQYELKDHFAYTNLFNNYVDLKSQINKHLKKEIKFETVKDDEDLKLKHNSVSNIISIIDQFNTEQHEDELNLSFKDFLNKDMIYKPILWFISKSYLIYLIPDFFCKDKFKILKNSFRIFHANYYHYKKRKNNHISDLRIKNTINLIKKKKL